MRFSECLECNSPVSSGLKQETMISGAHLKTKTLSVDLKMRLTCPQLNCYYKQHSDLGPHTPAHRIHCNPESKQDVKQRKYSESRFSHSLLSLNAMSFNIYLKKGTLNAEILLLFQRTSKVWNKSWFSRSLTNRVWQYTTRISRSVDQWKQTKKNRRALMYLKESEQKESNLSGSPLRPVNVSLLARLAYFVLRWNSGAVTMATPSLIIVHVLAPPRAPQDKLTSYWFLWVLKFALLELIFLMFMIQIEKLREINTNCCNLFNIKWHNNTVWNRMYLFIIKIIVIHKSGERSIINTSKVELYCSRGYCILPDFVVLLFTD